MGKKSKRKKVSDTLPPKPPETLQKIKWFLVYGSKHKKIIALGVLIFILAWFAKNYVVKQISSLFIPSLKPDDVVTNSIGIKPQEDEMAKHQRDDFTPKTKEIIAQRAGYRCSYPYCRKLTHGPKSSANGAMHLGEAAHISAAAPGGARYDASITTEERVSPNNGIWACVLHARLIDKDEDGYPKELLLEWKQNAEDFADSEMKHGIRMADNSTRDHALKIEDEINENYEKIKNIVDPKQKVVLPNGMKIQRLVSNAAIAKHVKTEIWKALTPTISIELQRKYKKIYLYTNAISDDSNVLDPIKPIMLFDNAKSFVEEYQKLFGKTMDSGAVEKVP